MRTNTRQTCHSGCINRVYLKCNTCATHNWCELHDDILVCLAQTAWRVIGISNGNHLLILFILTPIPDLKSLLTPFFWDWNEFYGNEVTLFLFVQIAGLSFYIFCEGVSLNRLRKLANVILCICHFNDTQCTFFRIGEKLGSVGQRCSVDGKQWKRSERYYPPTHDFGWLGFYVAYTK